MRKKFIAIIFSLLLVLGAMTLCGCNKPQEPVNEDVIVERLEFEESNVVITLGDVFELGVSYNEISGETLKWSSSNVNVVSVDANGYAQARSVGSSIISVEYGTKRASCNVQVTTNGNIPVLAFDDDVDVDNGLTVYKNTTFGLGTHILFNGKTFNDAEIEYYTSNSEVGQVIDNNFVSNNVVGETDITVFATWRNQFVSSKNIKVRVISDKSVIINDGSVKDITLYTASSHEGKDYPTFIEVNKISISEDGNLITDYTLSVLDTNIANAENVGGVWKINALKAGKTYAVVSYNGVDGKTDIPFTLSVNYPVAEYSEKLLYSVKDGKFFSKTEGELKTVNTFFNGFGEIVSVNYNGKGYPVSDNIINTVSEGKDQTITVYNGTVGYKVIFDAYTMVFDELSDFEKIYATTPEEKANVIKGTYVLAKNLIEPNTVLSMPEGKVSADFGGVFDGMGHIVSCTLNRGEIGNFGLFGCILCGATIKNLAIDNTTIDGNVSTKKVAGVICSEPSQLSSTLYTESTLENVYVNVKFSSEGQVNLPFMGNVQWNTVLKNVIIVSNDVPLGTQYGSFARGATKKTTDSYIISNTVIYYTADNPTQKFTPVPESFESFAELKNSGKDFSTFSSEYWDLSKGIPVWHGLLNTIDLGTD